MRCLFSLLLAQPPFHWPSSPSVTFDLPHIPDQTLGETEQYMGEIINKLAEFGTNEQVHKWTNEFIEKAQDYTSRDAMDEWYETLVKSYGPRLVGTKACFLEMALHKADLDVLPKFGTQPDNICWCTR